MTTSQNTNNGYFYKDPVAAIWMMKHHAMRIGILEPANRVIARSKSMIVHGGDDFHEFSLEDLYGWLVHSEAIDWQFYLHPDSLHLLEPLVGDMILHGSYKREQDDRPEGWSAALVTGVISPEYLAELREESGITKPLCYAYDEEIMICHSIIQRDGKPFHWPESEAV